MVLPGGYSAGDEVFYRAEDFTFANGFQLKRGAKGKVIRACDDDDAMLTVKFPGSEKYLDLLLTELSRTRALRHTPGSRPLFSPSLYFT